MPAEVRQDVTRLRMLLDHVVALGHQLFEAHAGLDAGGPDTARAPASARCVVERLEKRRRIGGVDEHGNIQARARVPHRIELRDRRPSAGCRRLFLSNMPKIFDDLADATAPAFTSASSCAPPSAPNPGPTGFENRCWRTAPSDPCTGCRGWPRRRACRRSPNDPLRLISSLRFNSSIAVDHFLKLVGGHRRRLMAVDVDYRKFRARDQVLRHDQRRLRFVFADGRRWKLRLASFCGARANLSGAWVCCARDADSESATTPRRARTGSAHERQSFHAEENFAASRKPNSVSPGALSGDRRRQSFL